MTIFPREGCSGVALLLRRKPLVWAHAEYLKLLRSAADGQVFDRIQVVADRYAVPKGKRTFTNHIEIFEPNRPISVIFSGYTLRIVDPERFRVVYTFDNWVTTLTRELASVGYSGSLCGRCYRPRSGWDSHVYPCVPGQDQQDDKVRWLGRNIDVSVVPLPASTEV